MNSLFRKLRAEMLSDNRIGRYLAYAVGEVLLIVIGIMIAVQLSNLNEQRRNSELERAYLERMASEIRSNVARFSQYRETANATRQVIQRFAAAMNNPAATNAELIKATRDYFSTGWLFPDFEPTTTTFDDLEATGNLQVIRNNQLRQAMIELYAVYKRYKRSLDTNVGWGLPVDARLTYEYDALRWDERTASLFPELAADEAASDIRSHAEILNRSAAIHFWTEHNTLANYEEAISHTESVLEKVDAELGKH
jgi:hypothetical protein